MDIDGVSSLTLHSTKFCSAKEKQEPVQRSNGGPFRYEVQVDAYTVRE